MSQNDSELDSDTDESLCEEIVEESGEVEMILVKKKVPTISLNTLSELILS